MPFSMIGERGQEKGKMAAKCAAVLKKFQKFFLYSLQFVILNDYHWNFAWLCFVYTIIIIKELSES